METFARLGYQCGRLISGKYLGKDFVDSNQILQIFNDLFRKYNIKDNKLQQKLKENFCRFFIELDPDFQKLKFHLAQNFYILKLLGINQESQLLSKNAFAGSEIYLDTNVVLASFLSESKPYQAFREFHKISNEIDIKTYVTSITRNEVTDVVAYQKQISNTYNNIPESKQAKIRNRFYQTYRKNKELDSKYSINDLFDPFENLKENLQNFFGIPLIYENIYNELLLDNKEFVDIKAKIQKISLEKRRREKSPNALTHDAFHYKLITTKREENPKTWLLTLDTSLPLVSEILLGSETRPYCFTLDNWLQCISPFVTTETELADFSFIFSNVFGLGLLPAEQIYDIEDFVMFSDLEVDIKLMPEPIVDQTVSFIRNEILKGRIYNKDILKESSYRLQKYLINLTSKYRENEFLSNELGISKEKIKTLESSLQ
jgi:predicted nucleic acid-binding protein